MYLNQCVEHRMSVVEFCYKQVTMLYKLVKYSKKQVTEAGSNFILLSWSRDMIRWFMKICWHGTTKII